MMRDDIENPYQKGLSSPGNGNTRNSSSIMRHSIRGDSSSLVSTICQGNDHKKSFGRNHHSRSCCSWRSIMMTIFFILFTGLGVLLYVTHTQSPPPGMTSNGTLFSTNGDYSSLSLPPLSLPLSLSSLSLSGGGLKLRGSGNDNTAAAEVEKMRAEKEEQEQRVRDREREMERVREHNQKLLDTQAAEVRRRHQQEVQQRLEEQKRKQEQQMELQRKEREREQREEREREQREQERARLTAQEREREQERLRAEAAALSAANARAQAEAEAASKARTASSGRSSISITTTTTTSSSTNTDNQGPLGQIPDPPRVIVSASEAERDVEEVPPVPRKHSQPMVEKNEGESPAVVVVVPAPPPRVEEEEEVAPPMPPGVVVAPVVSVPAEPLEPPPAQPAVVMVELPPDPTQPPKPVYKSAVVKGQACKSPALDPFKRLPVDSFTPPENAALEDVLTWEDHVKEMMSRISKIQVGGEPLRLQIADEIKKMSIIRFQLFCKYV